MHLGCVRRSRPVGVRRRAAAPGPPFDMSYITTTHLSSISIPGRGGQRPGERAQRAGEAVRHPFRQGDAADLITRLRAIPAPSGTHKDIILKPLLSSGGVPRAARRQFQFAAPGSVLAAQEREPVVADASVPENVMILINSRSGRRHARPRPVPGRGEARSKDRPPVAASAVEGRAPSAGATRNCRDHAAGTGQRPAPGIDVIGDYTPRTNMASPRGRSDGALARGAELWDHSVDFQETRGGRHDPCRFSPWHSAADGVGAGTCSSKPSSRARGQRGEGSPGAAERRTPIGSDTSGRRFSWSRPCAGEPPWSRR